MPGTANHGSDRTSIRRNWLTASIPSPQRIIINRAAKAEKHYLRDALDAVLAGEKPEADKTPPRGCSVKYEKK